jgi:hypothetical protein
MVFCRPRRRGAGLVRLRVVRTREVVWRGPIDLDQLAPLRTEGANARDEAVAVEKDSGPARTSMIRCSADEVNGWNGRTPLWFLRMFATEVEGI